MIEIIAGVFAGSFVLTWAVALVFFYRKIRPQFESKSFQILNQNLNKVEMRWSNKNSDFSSLKTGSLEEDRNLTFKSFFLITTLCSLVSVLGFLLLFLVLLSGKSRKERIVFKSPLASEVNLEKDQVIRYMEEIKNSF
jgi:hypothetical protein